jgi:hypothetical protein
MFIETADIVFLRLYDVADEIRLDRLSSNLFSGRLPFRQGLVRVDNQSIDLVRPPAAVELGPQSWVVGGEHLDVSLSARFFDFGVISLGATATLGNLDLEQFADRAIQMGMGPDLDRLFETELRTLMDSVSESLVDRRETSFFSEEYTLYVVRRTAEPVTKSDLKDLPALIRLIFGEKKPLSRQQAHLALENAFSYTENDLIILNYNNAFIVEEGDYADLRLLLEYANVQLLEARYYDDLLNRRLEKLFKDLGETRWGLTSVFSGKMSRIARTAMQLILETELMTDHLTSAVRVTEDVYYAQIYNRALQLFRTKAWLLRMDEKLRAMRETVELLNQEFTSRRAEILEWIIILLIAVEVVKIFL